MCTGIFYQNIPPTSQEAVNIQRSLGSDAIELSCNRKDRLADLLKLDVHEFRKNLKHLSLHAPTDLEYANNDETKRAFKLIEKAHQKFNFNVVVIHSEGVKDFSILKNPSFPIGIENADWRKDFGQTVEDMEKVFDGNDTGFVLDVNHCFTNDRSMKLASDLVGRFFGRICEIHLSGFMEFHEPIYITQQKEILRAVPRKNCPIIIESVCSNENEARRELQYVKDYFHCLT